MLVPSGFGIWIPTTQGNFMNRSLFIRQSLAVMGCLIASLSVRAAEIDVRPLDLQVVDAFPGLQWTGWDFGADSGKPQAIRPILVTHFGDGSGRIVVPTQQGVIHSIDPGASATKVFLDITPKVAYDDKTNEEGFLGLAFHPKFADNGQFFVYYTNKAKKHQNVVARYRVSKSDPQKADPESEEILLTFDKPFWNHDGGTIVFGPDGCLYIALGDGGLANDPFGNGQKLSTLLGKILRIDVDHAGDKTPYAIPKDNPFVGREGARGEIWAYGLRNVWRMAFDKKTGVLWAGDVGQDVWEEIDLIVKGGNYGWNVREGLHPFVRKGGKPPEADVKPADMIDPIFEYHHDLGKSITGGHVYRGAKHPELVGAYLYADYVSGKMWALTYDEAAKKVVANREISLPKGLAVMSFGEDQDGESYLTTFAVDGKGVYRLEKK
jgi:glucose/arabinose dehydrogenase